VTSPGGRRVGFIGFNIWMTAIDAPWPRRWTGSVPPRGIVVDLRGNPGSLAVMMSGIAGHFFADPPRCWDECRHARASSSSGPTPGCRRSMDVESPLRQTVALWSMT
jgi:hypothetical protein